MGKSNVLQDAPKRIKQLQFSVFSPQEVVQLAEFEVTHRDLYVAGEGGLGKTPAPGGLLDRRLVSPFPVALPLGCWCRRELVGLARTRQGGMLQDGRTARAQLASSSQRGAPTSTTRPHPSRRVSSPLLARKPLPSPSPTLL